MPFALHAEECYCAICDMYFSSLEQRAEHIQATTRHPECNYCQRRFLNKNILRNHFIYSRHHHYCASCEIEFQTPSGLRYHIEHAPVHCDDSDDEDEGEYNPGDVSSTEWEEEMGQLAYPDEPEVVAHSDDDDSDDSWEAYDDYDYEDAEDLDSQEEESEDEEDDEEAEDQGEEVVPQFSCPMCQGENPKSLACAPCGHLFCSPCIMQALKHTNACPICSEAGAVEQLRKIFLA